MADDAMIGASDATFHIMWVILFNAVDDFGVREFNEAVRMSSMATVPTNPAIESVKHKILDEALHGALGRWHLSSHHRPMVLSSTQGLLTGRDRRDEIPLGLEIARDTDTGKVLVSPLVQGSYDIAQHVERDPVGLGSWSP